MVRLICFVSLLFVAFAGPAAAEKVDLGLVLAVDISGSIDADEARLQRQGYVEAINHPAVMAAIHSGYYKRIAVTYVEWAGDPYQSILADWAVIHDAASAKAFADIIANQPIDTAQWTSISGAIRFGMDMFALSPYQARRRVIDISGDGANNNGLPILPMRKRAIEAGYVINGLPIVNGKPSRFGMPQIPNLDTYYRECVIGGTGAFIIVANGFQDFARAIRRKLILEIAGRPAPAAPGTAAAAPRLRPGVVHADYHAPTRDCMDGERWLQLHFDDF